MKSILLAIVALFAVLCQVGCSAEPGDAPDCHGFYRFEGLTTSEEGAVRVAAADFNHFVGTEAVKFSNDSTCVIRPHACEDLSPTAIACYEPKLDYNRSGDINLNRDEMGVFQELTHVNCAPGTICFNTIFMHEMGHSIGMEHVKSDPHAVMSPAIDYEGDGKWTAADVAECQKAGYCNQTN